MEWTAFLEAVGAPQSILSSDAVSFDPHAFAAEISAILTASEEPSLAPSQILDLLTYRVPKLGEGGSCSIENVLEPEPFHLTSVFGGSTENEAQTPTSFTHRIWRLNQVVEKLHKQFNIDWIGIYRATTLSDGTPALVKEAYRGSPSRAIFPLTAAFAEGSTNSTVGLSGKMSLIQDVANFEGPFYICSKKVQSEICIPILDPQTRTVRGIVDAESHQLAFFQGPNALSILALCWVLSQTNMALPSHQ